jgi:hypothetical protein
MGTKTCRGKCGQTKPLDQFYEQAGSQDGRRNVCIACWKLNNVERTKRAEKAAEPPQEGVSVEQSEDRSTVTFVGPVRTLDAALKAANVDQKVWDVERWIANKWASASKLGKGDNERIVVTPLWQIKVWLVRKKAETRSVMSLLEEIAKGGKVRLPVYRRPLANRKSTRRALEISIVDPHLGLHCFKPQSDMSWSLEECEQMFMATTERLIAAAEPYGPFEKIVCPIGNDYMHVDTVFHTTTAGTGQPEAESIHETFVRGKKLILWFIERLRRLGPVEVLSIPGNHDRLMAFSLAQLVAAYYEGAKAKDVEVDASASPYKFWRFGVSLLGFEHGHSVKAIRLAALMANETRLDGWREARFCEWHLGDQHRKGSSMPSMFEEQGVSIEYLPGLTPPNEWHRLKAYNWQKRGAMAFVYDHAAGPIARLQVNFDNYTGKQMGDDVPVRKVA